MGNTPEKGHSQASSELYKPVVDNVSPHQSPVVGRSANQAADASQHVNYLPSKRADSGSSISKHLSGRLLLGRKRSDHGSPLSVGHSHESTVVEQCISKESSSKVETAKEMDNSSLEADLLVDEAHGEQSVLCREHTSALVKAHGSVVSSLSSELQNSQVHLVSKTVGVSNTSGHAGTQLLSTVTDAQHGSEPTQEVDSLHRNKPSRDEKSNVIVATDKRAMSISAMSGSNIQGSAEPHNVSCASEKTNTDVKSHNLYQHSNNKSFESDFFAEIFSDVSVALTHIIDEVSQKLNMGNDESTAPKPDSAIAKQTEDTAVSSDGKCEKNKINAITPTDQIVTELPEMNGASENSISGNAEKKVHTNESKTVSVLGDSDLQQDVTDLNTVAKHSSDENVLLSTNQKNLHIDSRVVDDVLTVNDCDEQVKVLMQSVLKQVESSVETKVLQPDVLIRCNMNEIEDENMGKHILHDRHSEVSDVAKEQMSEHAIHSADSNNQLLEMICEPAQLNINSSSSEVSLADAHSFTSSATDSNGHICLPIGIEINITEQCPDQSVMNDTEKLQTSSSLNEDMDRILPDVVAVLETVLETIDRMFSDQVLTKSDTESSSVSSVLLNQVSEGQSVNYDQVTGNANKLAVGVVSEHSVNATADSCNGNTHTETAPGYISPTDDQQSRFMLDLVNQILTDAVSVGEPTETDKVVLMSQATDEKTTTHSGETASIDQSTPNRFESSSHDKNTEESVSSENESSDSDSDSEDGNKIVSVLPEIVMSENMDEMSENMEDILENVDETLGTTGMTSQTTASDVEVPYNVLDTDKTELHPVERAEDNEDRLDTPASAHEQDTSSNKAPSEILQCDSEFVEMADSVAEDDSNLKKDCDVICSADVHSVGILESETSLFVDGDMNTKECETRAATEQVLECMISSVVTEMSGQQRKSDSITISVSELSSPNDSTHETDQNPALSRPKFNENSEIEEVVDSLVSATVLQCSSSLENTEPLENDGACVQPEAIDVVTNSGAPGPEMPVTVSRKEVSSELDSSECDTDESSGESFELDDDDMSQSDDGASLPDASTLETKENIPLDKLDTVTSQECIKHSDKEDGESHPENMQDDEREELSKEPDIVSDENSREEKMIQRAKKIDAAWERDQVLAQKWNLKPPDDSQAASSGSNASYGSPAGVPSSSRREIFSDSLADGAEAPPENLKAALSEIEEKYRRAMLQIAQLDNERSQLQYQTQQLQDLMEEQEDELYRLKREHTKTCQDMEQQKRMYSALQKKFSNLEEMLRQRDELIQCLEKQQKEASKAVKDVFDLKETVLWKNKKIEALVRQIEFYKKYTPSTNGQAEQGLVLVGDNGMHALDNGSGEDRDSYYGSSKPGLALVSPEAAQLLDGSGPLDVQLRQLAHEKQDLEDQVRHLQLQLEEERRENAQSENPMYNSYSENGPTEMQILEVQREANRQVNEYKMKLQKTEQDLTAFQGNMSRLESQLQRYKQTSELYEKNEDEMRAEKRKLMRDLRTALDRIEEMEMTNSHLEKRLERARASRTAISSQS